MRPSTMWVAEPARGWILYDADCGFCTRWAWRLARIGRVGSRGFHLAPLQAPWVRQRLAMPEKDLLHEMRVLTADDVLYGGADAMVFLARQIWWTRPFTLLTRLPGVMPLVRAAYRWVARNRHRLSAACALPGASRRKASPSLPGTRGGAL
ncbi:MAG TPA: DUF393 domain-containing protein [Candidatus Acidoferrales bacterium]|nr:DUF393 domain-containing protein [Candidatus Acidoferrales bacterium]